MKKIIAFVFIIMLVLSSVSVSALGTESLKCTVFKEDLSGDSYQLYFSNCRGHYSSGAVTVYVTNTSKHSAKFQVTVGWQGSKVQTMVESGYVELKPGVTGRFVLENLSEYPEKANDDLGYVPNSKLGENSVVRVMARGLEENDTFVVTGIDSYSMVRDSGFSDITPNAVMKQPLVPQYVSESKLVIKDEEKEDKGDGSEYLYTMVQPDTESVNKFIIATVASAVLCLGGIAIYTVSFIIRRNKNDGE